MLSGDWMRKHALAIAASLALICAAGVTLSFFIGLLRSGWEGQLASEKAAEIRQKDYAQTGRNPEQSRCVKLPLLDQKPCLDAAANAARENNRDDRDLVAQEVTAVWTRITAYAAIGGIFASVCGLGLVFVAYREARKTNEITREIGERQVRAYISFKDITFAYLRNSNKFKALIGFKNSGASPAINCQAFVQAKIYFFDGIEGYNLMRSIDSIQIPDIAGTGITFDYDFEHAANLPPSKAKDGMQLHSVFIHVILKGEDVFNIEFTGEAVFAIKAHNIREVMANGGPVSTGAQYVRTPSYKKDYKTKINFAQWPH